jgi:hypothetical protein
MRAPSLRSTKYSKMPLMRSTSIWEVIPEISLLLVETPKDGFGRLVSIIANYAKNAPRPFEMVVSDQNGTLHPFPPHSDVGEKPIEDHLRLAHYGEPGDRRPLLRPTISPPS